MSTLYTHPGFGPHDAAQATADVLRIKLDRAEGALAGVGNVPTGDPELGIRLLTAERDALAGALDNARIELNNVHREYLAGRHGGCPCIVPASGACQLEVAISDAEAALRAAGGKP